MSCEHREIHRHEAIVDDGKGYVTWWSCVACQTEFSPNAFWKQVLNTTTETRCAALLDDPDCKVLAHKLIMAQAFVGELALLARMGLAHTELTIVQIDLRRLHEMEALLGVGLSTKEELRAYTQPPDAEDSGQQAPDPTTP